MWVYCFNISFLIMNLIWALYINFKYLPQLRIRGCIVWMFYMIMYVVLIGGIINCAGEINNINGEYIKYVDQDVEYDAS